MQPCRVTSSPKPTVSPTVSTQPPYPWRHSSLNASHSHRLYTIPSNPIGCPINNSLRAHVLIYQHKLYGCQTGVVPGRQSSADSWSRIFYRLYMHIFCIFCIFHILTSNLHCQISNGRKKNKLQNHIYETVMHQSANNDPAIIRNTYEVNWKLAQCWYLADHSLHTIQHMYTKIVLLR